MPQIPKRLEKYLSEAIKEIGETNTRLIGEHLERCAALPSEPGESRLNTIAVRLRTVARILSTPLDALTEKDLQKLNLAMREREMTSAQDYRKVLKRFLLLKDKKKYIDLIDSDYLKAPRKNGHKLLVNPEEFWSEAECNRYLEEAKFHSPRQSAWAALWLGTGCRPHELLSLCKKDVEFKDNMLIVRVGKDTKTGRRSIVLQSAEGGGVWHYLQEHWNSLKDNEPLFSCSYAAMVKVHRRICKRAKIGAGRRINFYIARKMALTRFYNRFGMVKAASMAGHTPGSNSMKHYVGLSEEMLQQKDLPGVEMRTCPNPQCGTENEPHFTSCVQCGAPLNHDKFNALVQKNMEGLIELVLKKHGLIKSIG